MKTNAGNTITKQQEAIITILAEDTVSTKTHLINSTTTSLRISPVHTIKPTLKDLPKNAKAKISSEPFSYLFWMR
jgi:hypothetical protein